MLLGSNFPVKPGNLVAYNSHAIFCCTFKWRVHLNSHFPRDSWMIIKSNTFRNMCIGTGAISAICSLNDHTFVNGVREMPKCVTIFVPDNECRRLELCAPRRLTPCFCISVAAAKTARSCPTGSWIISQWPCVNTGVLTRAMIPQAPHCPGAHHCSPLPSSPQKRN